MHQPKNTPPVLTVRLRDAATMLGVSPRTIWNLLGNGVLPRVKIGRSTAIPVSAIEALVARGGMSIPSVEGEMGP